MLTTPLLRPKGPALALPALCSPGLGIADLEVHTGRIAKEMVGMWGHYCAGVLGTRATPQRHHYLASLQGEAEVEGPGQERQAGGPYVSLPVDCCEQSKPPTPSRQHQSKALGPCPGKGEIWALSC